MFAELFNIFVHGLFLNSKGIIAPEQIKQMRNIITDLPINNKYQGQYHIDYLMKHGNVLLAEQFWCFSLDTLDVECSIEYRNSSNFLSAIQVSPKILISIIQTGNMIIHNASEAIALLLGMRNYSFLHSPVGEDLHTNIMYHNYFLWSAIQLYQESLQCIYNNKKELFFAILHDENQALLKDINRNIKTLLRYNTEITNDIDNILIDMDLAKLQLLHNIWYIHHAKVSRIDVAPQKEYTTSLFVNNFFIFWDQVAKWSQEQRDIFNNTSIELMLEYIRLHRIPKELHEFLLIDNKLAYHLNQHVISICDTALKMHKKREKLPLLIQTLLSGNFLIAKEKALSFDGMIKLLGNLPLTPVFTCNISERLVIYYDDTNRTIQTSILTMCQNIQNSSPDQVLTISEIKTFGKKYIKEHLWSC